MDIYSQKIWRKGCGYIVGKPDDWCNKCGNQHSETAAEAGIFDKFMQKEPKNDD